MGQRGIALDIDGVMAPFERPWRQQFALDAAAVALLNRTMVATGATLVLSSSWRLCTWRDVQVCAGITVDPWNIITWMTAWLRSFGFLYHITAITPSLRSGDRGEEIALAMAELGIEEWVAFDDCANLFIDPMWRKRLICTHPIGILTSVHVDRAVDLLCANKAA